MVKLMNLYSQLFFSYVIFTFFLTDQPDPIQSKNHLQLLIPIFPIKKRAVTSEYDNIFIHHNSFYLSILICKKHSAVILCPRTYSRFQPHHSDYMALQYNHLTSPLRYAPYLQTSLLPLLQ